MTRTPWLRLSAFLAALALLAAACGGGRDDDDESSDDATDTTEERAEGTIDASNCDESEFTTGIDDETIKIGTSFPQSGTFAAFADISLGYKAYFDYVNEELGGIDGRRIELIDTDDQYDPGRTVTNVDELVQQDEVFGLFNIIGTANNLAVWDQLGEECIPNFFAGTGSSRWGDEEGHPWTIGSFPAYSTETLLYVDYLKENIPDATVALLYQNDDFGAEYAATFKTAIEGTDIEVVAEETYESSNPEVSAQVTSLASSGADALLSGTTALACPGALNAVQDAGWDTQVFISGTCTSPTLTGLANEGAAEGFISTTNLMDPRDPQYDGNEDMALYLEKVAEYQPDADPQNFIVGYGWTMGALLVHALENAETLDRLGVMEAARNLDNVQVGIVLPIAPYNTGPGDAFPAELGQVIQFDEAQGYPDYVGDPVDFEGQTAELVPPELITG